ncbi:Na+/H+ antiporter NhaA [Zhouia amylolytica]|uniref:Na(+)/H(+) antiporter NhaA n=1 Tax=Zhouia amylolytica AD3 TaxID=1286632 RepID=W2UPZ8_9FLAO|nr:Na+/H+ antiporter NhaA [Zhouia amylolytica]ETN96073.1 Na+/H+ antiporter NhaA [Zhouia amylolytica AD3]
MIQKVFISPFQRFVKIESLSGILLFCAAVIAVIWANSPFSESYTDLWNFKIGISSENFELQKPLLLWVNDGFMAIFFFLIGLEIKRELLIGELNSVKKMAFPFVAALGGMLIPMFFFMFLNANPETSNGWGIPMATDIAFSLAVLKLLGNRIPLSLKIFLTAFAIVDDIGAVLVIAVFYTNNIAIDMIIYGAVLLLVLYYLTYKGIYSKYFLFGTGIIVWVLFLKSGVHPTIAGILLAFAVPIRQRISTKTFVSNLSSITNKIQKGVIEDEPVLSKEQIAEIDNLEEWTDKFQSPLQHLEHKLHDWVAYFIIPIFALANAGVSLSSDAGIDTALALNITLCLIFGNSIGITTLVLLTNKLKIIEIPEDISKAQILGVACLAGIGFTMAIFVASLAFSDTPIYVDSAKIGILAGSMLSALLGYTILRITSKPNPKNDD